MCVCMCVELGKPVVGLRWYVCSFVGFGTVRELCMALDAQVMNGKLLFPNGLEFQTYAIVHGLIATCASDKQSTTDRNIFGCALLTFRMYTFTVCL